jgi:hypothetical protein
LLPHAPIPEISGPVQLATLVWLKVVVPHTAIAVWGVIPGMVEQGGCAVVTFIIPKMKNNMEAKKRISSQVFW